MTMVAGRVEKLLNKHAGKTKTLQFAMNVPGLGIHYSYGERAQRFHSASVGKLMTAVMIFQAIEQGLIGLDSPVSGILPPGTLDQLFSQDGSDDQHEVTIRQLLCHTSGINDYFEGTTLDGRRFADEIVRHPDTFWTPAALLDYTRTHQRPVGAPGRQFLYSDTGYILLGLCVEALHGMPFHEALENLILAPFGMKDTCLCFYSSDFDSARLAPLYLDGTDIRAYRSLSCDFSGGGLSTTAADLMLFLEHLHQHRLIGPSSLQEMAQFHRTFRKGIAYGTGMMQLRFEQFFFLLKHLPRLQGHLGFTGVHAWYDPQTKSSFVMNVGNNKDMVRSFKLLIGIVQIVYSAMRKQRK